MRTSLVADKLAHRFTQRGRLGFATMTRRKQPLHPPVFDWLRARLADPAVWSAAAFGQLDLLDWRACEAARQRLEGSHHRTRAERMVDEWTCSFALSTHVFAKEHFSS